MSELELCFENYLTWYGSINLYKLESKVQNYLFGKIGYKTYLNTLQENCKLALTEKCYEELLSLLNI